jgi:hypothetical protein
MGPLPFISMSPRCSKPNRPSRRCRTISVTWISPGMPDDRTRTHRFNPLGEIGCVLLKDQRDKVFVIDIRNRSDEFLIADTHHNISLAAGRTRTLPFSQLAGQATVNSTRGAPSTHRGRMCSALAGSLSQLSVSMRYRTSARPSSSLISTASASTSALSPRFR